MNSEGLMQAYKNEVVRIARKIRRGDFLSEGERYFANGVLDAFAASLPSLHFYLNQFVEPASAAQETSE